jgi:hypothetical protein
MIQQRHQLWQRTLRSVAADFQALGDEQRSWIGEAVRRIGRGQQQLHALFLAADGPSLCSRCQGACCACGTHHFTLVNLLAWLAEGLSPPDPDFALTCPFLAADGCRLAVDKRPFNCVIFLCEQVWERLTPVQQQQARQLEDMLRRQYLAFSQRFAGASPHGLLIRAERLNGQGLLAAPGSQASASDGGA